jgi:histidinol-phosphate aminotransferase
MSNPRPIKGILDIAPYVGGDAGADGLARIVKLSSNESATGASPKATAAFRAAADSLHRYPDGASSDLRRALAEMYGLNVDGVICGNGSDEIISYLTHAYCGSGDEVLYSQHGFLMYPLSAMASGATPVAAPEEGFTTSVDALIAAVSERTRIVFVANPNNPTGTYLPESEVRRLRAGLPDDVLLVIDSAYAEFVTRNDYSPGIEIVDGHENTVMTRTFSKIYGLAALRLGWAYCPVEIAQVYHRVRPPFNVNAAAQAAGVAALDDIGHTDRARVHNEEWLDWLTRSFRSLGLEVIPSVGNFVTVKFGNGDDGRAQTANAFLKQRGILPRDITAYGLGDYLRFTVGLAEENEAAVAAIKEFLENDRG